MAGRAGRLNRTTCKECGAAGLTATSASSPASPRIAGFSILMATRERTHLGRWKLSMGRFQPHGSKPLVRAATCFLITIKWVSGAAQVVSAEVSMYAGTADMSLRHQAFIPMDRYTNGGMATVHSRWT